MRTRVWPNSVFQGFLLFAVVISTVSPSAARPLVDTVLPLSEIIWRPEGSTEFVGSPSIIRLSNGSYLASHDDFGPGGVANQVHIYASHDQGESWSALAAVPGQYWSNLFVRDDGVYLLGTSSDGYAGEGSIAISHSTDSGVTWQRQIVVPAPDAAVGSYATGATPLLVSNGRLWRGLELWAAPHRWPQDFQAVLVSAAEDADLMDPSSWSITAPLAFDTAWFADVQPLLPTGGYLEGNAVERPDGSVGLLMRMPRMQLDGAYFIDLNHACLLSLQPSAHFGLPVERAATSSAGGSADNPAAGSVRNSSVITAEDVQPVDHQALAAAATRRQLRAKAAQDPNQDLTRSSQISLAAAELVTSDIQHGSRLKQQRMRQRSDIALEAGTLAFERVVNMPGGGNKFVVRKDSATGLYVALTNPQTPDANGNDQRNLLQLVTSPDLVTWTSVTQLLADDTGFQWVDSLRYTGYQYVDWQFEGDDLICVIRTSYRGANSYHNSNRMTFMRVPGWRSMLTRPGMSAAYLRRVKPHRGLGASGLRQQVAAAGALLQQAASSFAWGSRCCSLGGLCGPCHPMPGLQQR